jgi:hypothetical protein
MFDTTTVMLYYIFVVPTARRSSSQKTAYLATIYQGLQPQREDRRSCRSATQGAQEEERHVRGSGNPDLSAISYVSNLSDVALGFRQDLSILREDTDHRRRMSFPSPVEHRNLALAPARKPIVVAALNKGWTDTFLDLLAREGGFSCGLLLDDGRRLATPLRFLRVCFPLCL